jgi:enamine deaminase RidA (YjgF/YER057c/UK114 family)
MSYELGMAAPDPARATAHATYASKTRTEAREREMKRMTIRPTDVHQPTGYAHAVRVDGMLYVSGQVPRRPNDDIADPSDPEAQIRQVFANLLAVLQAAGADSRSLVKITTYLTDPEHFETWRRVRDEVLEEPYPASTLVVVDSLSFPEYLVETEAIAVIEDQTR